MPEAWTPTSAWAGIARRGPCATGAPGVVITPVTEAALATIVVRPDLATRLDEFVRARLGIGLPPAGRMHAGGAGALVWSAPGQWLAVAPQAGALEDLPAALAGVAAVTDQSDSRSLLRIGGPRARDALGKGASIDLHRTAFSAGFAAATRVAHMNVQFWQTDDAPTYTLAVPRSYARSFWTWLTAAAEEYAYEVVESPRRGGWAASQMR